MPYIEKRIYSGPMLEIERYAVSASGRRLPRKEKQNPSSEVQKNLNDKNAKKKLIRIVNTNFNTGDLFVSINYSKTYTLAQAKRHLQNYFRRLKTYRKRKSLPLLKYIAVTEMKKGKPHHHIIMNSDGLTMDEAETIWNQDDRVNISKLKPDAFGLQGLAKYIVKDPCNSKRWSQSKNLKKPRIVRKQIKRINIYKQPRPVKGYKIIDYEVTDNIYLGAYQYIVMTKFELNSE